MNITTKSGKTIDVDDESYVLDYGNGVIKHVFTDTRQMRMYTIDDEDIEMICEKRTPERTDAIARMSGTAAPQRAMDIAGYV